MITGVTLIKDGNVLGYPWKICIASMLSCCEEVIVNCDPGEDNTLEELHGISRSYPVRIVESVWDMKNTGDGRELAIQINNILPLVRSNWVLYLQADEMIYEKNAKEIIQLTDNISGNYSQIEFWRTYFWEALNRRNAAHEIALGRLFRTGTHIVGGDGMHLTRHSGEVFASPLLIYHYSRMGDEDRITKRIRNLDQLFHDRERISKFHPFSYNEVDPANLILYNGPHPAGVKEFYNV